MKELTSIRALRPSDIQMRPEKAANLQRRMDGVEKTPRGRAVAEIGHCTFDRLRAGDSGEATDLVDRFGALLLRCEEAEFRWKLADQERARYRALAESAAEAAVSAELREQYGAGPSKLQRSAAMVLKDQGWDWRSIGAALGAAHTTVQKWASAPAKKRGRKP